MAMLKDILMSLDDDHSGGKRVGYFTTSSDLWKYAIPGKVCIFILLPSTALEGSIAI
jgi:hypothetical protein